MLIFSAQLGKKVNKTMFTSIQAFLHLQYEFCGYKIYIYIIHYLQVLPQSAAPGIPLSNHRPPHQRITPISLTQVLAGLSYHGLLEIPLVLPFWLQAHVLVSY